MDKPMMFERDEMSFLMLCAWNNIKPDQAPQEFRAFYNESTKAAWERVAQAAKDYLSKDTK